MGSQRAMAVQALETTSSCCKRLIKTGLSIFLRGFNSSKCSTKAKMATARIKLLRNKREVVIRQMRRDIALLLQSRQDATARIRVEHVIREQKNMAANEIIELFCDLIVSRISIIAKQRECPADLKEGISSLIFAAPRCAEIPELLDIRSVFEKKYGKDFVSAATDLRPSCGVNRTLIEKLSVKTPMGEVKLKLLKEIAKEYQIEWDTAETEKELLEPLEEPIPGPNTFFSAGSMPVKPISVNPDRVPARSPGAGDRAMQYENAGGAAEAAAESAKKAIAAAQAAAFLANKKPNQNKSDDGHPITQINSQRRTSENNEAHLQWASPSFMESEEKVHRRHTFNGPPKHHSDIKFDESDCDEDIEMDPPPGRPPPMVPSMQAATRGVQVHPKLPDYDSLAARFEALKHHRNSMP